MFIMYQRYGPKNVISKNFNKNISCFFFNEKLSFSQILLTVDFGFKSTNMCVSLPLNSKVVRSNNNNFLIWSLIHTSFSTNIHLASRGIRYIVQGSKRQQSVLCQFYRTYTGGIHVSLVSGITLVACVRGGAVQSLTLAGLESGWSWRPLHRQIADREQFA